MIEPGVLLFGLFLALLAVGVPILTSVGVTALLFLWGFGLGLPVTASNVYANIAKFPLLAIPFFILAGFVMDRVGLSRGLVHLLNLIIGPVRGGLGLVAVGGCVFFGAISGTGPADTAAIGTVMIPAMVRRGYATGFAAALVAAAATTDVLIPPSVAFVVYAVITETSVSRLFAAGVIPGLLMGLALVVPVVWISRRRGWGGEPWGTPREILAAAWAAKWGLVAPVVILGGIYGGVFTPTEAAVVAVMYGLFVGFVVFRNLRFGDLYAILLDAAVATSVVMMVVGFAGLFSWTGSTLGVMDRTARGLLTLSDSPYVVLLLLNVMLVVAGMLLDAISIYYVFVPIFLPLMKQFGWDPIWFGVMMTVNLAIGTITPPVAVNLYVAARIAGVSIEEVSRWALPFFLALLAALLLVVYVPALSLWLPNALRIR
ncbi:MAG: TRAP transporter large permease [Candidatus Rokubacteria bacterium]|nr:TRAP transporter large permease [Candidatus Rokubacteria bacterium]MBI2015093.1 TRAP transporter large permease [Candidatus Rokubacteria bacterium]MBI2494942.1 TRAP transporter large permease [Candidatus Rokubacteria bacterium]